MGRKQLDVNFFDPAVVDPTCLYPEPMKNAAKNLATLSPTAQEKILSHNARRLYRLP